MLFTSRGTNNDKETSPLVIREAICNRTPSLIYNLPVYLGMYDNYDNLKFLNFDNKQENIKKILQELKLEPIKIIENDDDNLVEVKTDEVEHFYYETTKGKEDLLSYNYPNSCQNTLVQYGEGAAQYWSLFLFHEMDRDFIKIEPGDVFFDLGANIGMSSKYALLQGASEVHCFEPDPNLHKLIRKNIPQAFIYDNAISNEEKEIELYHWPYNPVNIGPKYKCHTINLKTVLKVPNKPIDYMKIDIEGFEEHLFDDLTIPELSNVNKLFIECHFKPTDTFCQTLIDKGFDIWVDHSGMQTIVYARNKHFKEVFEIEDEHEIQIIPSRPNKKKKIHIIDAYATTQDKLNILRKGIKSVKKFGGDIMLVSHCSFPQDIVDSVDYHIFDADNTFNINNVFGFRLDKNVEIQHNINKSHEFTIVRAMRLALAMAKQLKYEYFQFTEFDHIYSNEDILEIDRLERQLISEEKDFLFFMPETAKFGDIIGQFFETCFFIGPIDKFLTKFNEFFPETIEEYNENFATRFPNCLEHFFYNIFKDENCLIVNDFVKSYFKTSEINLSSWSGYEASILMDKNDTAYLVIINNNHIDYKFDISINGKTSAVTLKSGHTVIKLDESGEIKIKVSTKDGLIDTKNIIYNKKNHDEYKKLGTITILNKSYVEQNAPKEKLFKVEFDKSDNKLTFTYLGTQRRKILISAKDIDSRACVYSSEWEVGPGALYWMVPLPKIVIDFFNDPQFGGFLIEYKENGVLIEKEEMRFKTLSYTKPVMDLSDTEPIFMNYREFFDEGIYDKLDIQNRDVVFDIGANIGLWTAYILNKGAKKVYAFEPNKLAISQLNHNFKDNKNVVIVPKGVYHEHTKIPFYVDASNSLISSMINDEHKVLAYEVETVTIDEVLSEYNIDKINLLKMDIEGAEFDIFDNISTETMNKIDSLLIEYHDFYFPMVMHKVDHLITELEKFGYDVIKPDGVKYVFATKVKKKYWVNDGNTNTLKEVDLYEDGRTFTWELMDKGKRTGYHHQYNELYFMFNEFTNGCVYERYGCTIEKGDVVVDVGANIGVFANLASQRGAKKIYCFEPGDLAMSCLVKNAPKNAELFKSALGNIDGKVNLYLPSEGDTMSASCKMKFKIKNVVDATTIDFLFADGLFDKIDFLKIDAEGSEFDIINGISDNNLKKIRKISMEYHSNILGETPKEFIWKRLIDDGFKGFELRIGDGVHRIYNFWRE